MNCMDWSNASFFERVTHIVVHNPRSICTGYKDSNIPLTKKKEEKFNFYQSTLKYETFYWSYPMAWESTKDTILINSVHYKILEDYMI